jgi:hypothetical protein
MIDEYREYDITDVVLFKESFTETPLGYDPRNGISLQDIYRAEKSKISIVPNKTDTKGLIYFCTFDVEYAMINIYKNRTGLLKENTSLVNNDIFCFVPSFEVNRDPDDWDIGDKA